MFISVIPIYSVLCSLRLWTIILYSETALMQFISAVCIFIICSFANVQHLEAQVWPFVCRILTTFVFMTSVISSCFISKSLKIKIYAIVFTICTVWVRNLVSHFEGGTQTEGFWEESVEENIWTKKGGGRIMEKIAWQWTSWPVFITTYFFQFHFNIILTPMSRSSKWSLPFRFRTKFCTANSLPWEIAS